MNKLLDFLLLITGVFLTLYSLYFVSYAFYACKKPKSRPSHEPKNKFAVVIAARNEAAVIGNLIDSLKKQNYPHHLYDIYVVPNNCVDDTRQVAAAAGAEILDCQYAVNSKGDVLRHSFNQLMSVRYDYDAFCVFDADNVVDPEFLSKMNNALCEGIQVAQGYREAKNPFDTWITGCYKIYFTILNRFVNHARYCAGLSAYISGTGFVISTAVLKAHGGWRTITLSEDTEFSLQCMIHGVRIHWVPEAVTYDEQPLRLKQSLVQRTRWSSGGMQLLSLYAKRLSQSLNSHNFIQISDAILALMAPYVQLLSVIQLLLTFIAAFFLPYITLSKIMLTLLLSYLTTSGMALLTLIIDHKLKSKDIVGIMTFWWFVMTWTPLNLISLFRKTTRWYEIKHTRNVKADKFTVSRQDI